MKSSPIAIIGASAADLYAGYLLREQGDDQSSRSAIC